MLRIRSFKIRDLLLSNVSMFSKFLISLSSVKLILSSSVDLMCLKRNLFLKNNSNNNNKN